MSPERHLDPETLRLLLSGGLPPGEARRLAAHLDRDCAVCDEVLAAGGATLDGATDAALAAVAPPRARDAGNDLEFARIQRAVRGDGAPRRRAVTAALAVAAVALLGVGVVVKLAPAPQREWDGVKGPAAAAVVPARLRFAVSRGDGVERGTSGQVVPPDASLLFRIEVGAPAHVALLRAGGGETEVVFQRRAESAGAVDVTVDGGPAAYPLAGLAGPQRFVLVASPAPLTPDLLREAVQAPAGALADVDPRAPQLTLDVVEVTVR